MKPVISQIGKSVLGQSIDCWRISHGKTGERIFIIAGVHGDESEGMQLVNGLIQKIINTKTSHEFLIIPCLNKDGETLSLRSNFNDVDLNRNLPTKNWSQTFSNPRYKPGSHAGSEPETIAFLNELNGFLPTLIISLHSFIDSLILYNKGNGQFDGSVAMLGKTLDLKIVDKMDYEVSGSLNTYSLEKGIPTLTIEAPRDQSWVGKKEQFINCLFDFITSLSR